MASYNNSFIKSLTLIMIIIHGAMLYYTAMAAAHSSADSNNNISENQINSKYDNNDNNNKNKNYRHVQAHAPWLPATATWYGSPDGDGSDGGACGYGNLAASAYGTRVSAGSPVIFRNGEGCGACYQVRCVGGLCSRRPVTVVITDECPGGYCAFGRTHFDMSGSAFRRMAASASLSSSLLNVGEIDVLYRRVPCNFGRGVHVAFQVNQGATDFWFSVLIRYEDGDGDLAMVEVMEGQSNQWKQMRQLWGAYWCLNGGPMRGPFSMRLTTSSGSKLTAQDVIPSNWAPGGTYNTMVNFPH